MTRIEQSRLWPTSFTKPRWLEQGLPYQGMVPIVAAAVLAFVLTRSLWNTLAFGQVYSDLVVGGISWGDFDKSRDYRGLALFVGTLVAGSLGITLLVTRVIDAAHTALVRPACEALLIFSMLPALWRFGVVGANPFVKSTPKDAALYLIVALVVLGMLPRFRERLSAAAIVATGGRILLGMGLAMFACLGVGLSIARLSPEAARWLHEHDDLFTAAPAIIAAAVGILFLARAKTFAEADRWLDRMLVLLQIPLPLLVFAVVPSAQVIDEKLVPGTYQPALPNVLMAYVAVALACSAVQWYRLKPTQGTRSLREVCAPLCLAGVAVFVVVPPFGIPAYMPDLFQAGEELLPWQQWSHFGKLPFVDFAPIHGLMPLLRGWIGEVFFTDSAADFLSAQTVMLGMSAVATYVAFHYTAGPMVALFLTAFATPINDRFFFLTPALVILAWTYLLDRPRRWLACWLSMATFMVFYNASLGSAYTIGTSPAAAWMVYRLWRTDRRALAQLAAGVALVALLGLAIMPVREMTFGLITFIRENAKTNELVSGIPWQTVLPLRERYPVAGTTFLWDILRFSWLIVVVAALIQLWRQVTGHTARDRRLLWLSALLPLTLLLASAWTLNRIDPGHLSRTGELSRVAVGYLLPVLFLLGRPLATLPSVLMGLAVMGGFVVSIDPYEGQPPFTSSLTDKAFQIRSMPPAPHMVRGAELGLPQLGHIRIEEQFLGAIQDLKTEMDRLLKPGETYFDLTSNSAYYYYLDKAVPALYSAHFVAANSHQQGRMLEQLRANMPPVVLIAPRDDHDGGPPPMRSYFLFREFALKYVFIERGGYMFLVDPSRAPEAGPPGSPEQIALIDRHLGQADVAKISAAWGRNWNRLSDRFEPYATLSHTVEPEMATDGAGHPQTTGGTPMMLDYSLGEQPLAGRDVEYVLIRLKNVAQEPAGPTRVAVRWTEADGTTAPGTWVTASGETLLVPVCTCPRWLLSKQLATLHVEVHPNHGTTEVVVEEVRLLRLKPPI